jgi:hypothetical protein
MQDQVASADHTDRWSVCRAAFSEVGQFASRQHMALPAANAGMRAGSKRLCLQPMPEAASYEIDRRSRLNRGWSVASRVAANAGRHIRAKGVIR